MKFAAEVTCVQDVDAAVAELKKLRRTFDATEAFDDPWNGVRAAAEEEEKLARRAAKHHQHAELTAAILRNHR